MKSLSCGLEADKLIDQILGKNPQEEALRTVSGLKNSCSNVIVSVGKPL